MNLVINVSHLISLLLAILSFILSNLLINVFFQLRFMFWWIHLKALIILNFLYITYFYTKSCWFTSFTLHINHYFIIPRCLFIMFWKDFIQTINRSVTDKLFKSKIMFWRRSMTNIDYSRMEYTIVCITKCVICIAIWPPLWVMIWHRYIRSFLTIHLNCGGKLRLCNFIWCTNINKDFLLEKLWWCMRDYFLCHCF